VSAPRRISLVGSTGSIGRQAIDVMTREPGAFRVVAIGANRSVGELIEQSERLHPEVVAVGDTSLAEELAAAISKDVEVRVGEDGLSSLAEVGDTVLNAVVGFAGLGVTVRALRAGKRLALANKESLIAGAPVVQAARRTPGAEIIPVDSEHCAIHQCLGDRRHRSAQPEWPFPDTTGVSRLLITASGGPFRGRRREDLADVTVEEALAHPTWRMGPKITVDSSTLMNKGLEVLEAHELFGIDFERINVLIHPQSVIHSMVEFSDGATIAQLSLPDMRLPIGYALSYPDRLSIAFGSIDWSQLERLEFYAPDLETFPCLRLAFEAGREGGSAPAWLNAANEVAVDAFLGSRIAWSAIPTVVEETLASHEPSKLAEVEDVLAADEQARRVATAIVVRENPK
jgi:1-deoxy-D-xylulose-5-phosphate reductoisomerase